MSLADAARPAELPGAGYAPEEKGGPLVAVCSLCGGAGASTVTYLLAAASARRSATPVLACDAGSATAGLALYAGLRSARSLGELAQALQTGALEDERLYARDPSRLRLIATDRRTPLEVSRGAAERILGDARAAHGLTVVDCGTLAEPLQQIAHALATHVLWVVPATAGGVVRARQALRALPPGAAPAPVEAVVARSDPSGPRKAVFRELTELADERRAPLVLMPAVPDLADYRFEQAAQACAVTLDALATVLRR